MSKTPYYGIALVAFLCSGLTFSVTQADAKPKKKDEAKVSTVPPPPLCAPSTTLPANPPKPKLCSFASINVNCTILVDRLSPVTPPTIYVRRGGTVKVQVVRPSPFETLTLDWKSTAASVPPDSFSSVFSALSGPLTKGPIVVYALAFEGAKTPLDDIIDKQRKLLQEFTLDDIVTQLGIVSQSPPLNASSAGNPTPGFKASPWLETAAWKGEMTSSLQTGIANFKITKAELQAAVTQLDSQIAQLKKPTNPPLTKGQNDWWDEQLPKVTAIEAVLDQQAAARDDAASVKLVAALNALQVAINQIPDNPPTPTPYCISDPQTNDPNYELVTDTLNFTNNLAPLVKRVSADGGYTPGTPLHSLGDAATKQPLLNIAVQFQSSPRFEVSTGVLVPGRPFHSYSAAAGTSGSSKVLETLSYAIVPVANVNTLAYEFTGHRQRMALFGTVAVGYNPTTSAVEFGLGPSFSFKSIEFSAMVDIGRDTRLTGGLTVGGPLPANVSKPTTETYWSFKPAVGLSVRIPLGGASK